jgi:HK97 family phage major capsid protein
MKLHELKQKRNTIATDMRALHDKIGDNTWTDEQRTQWNAAKSELDSLDERIAREDELRRQDQSYIDDNGDEQRQNLQNDLANPAVKLTNAARQLLINFCVMVLANSLQKNVRQSKNCVRRALPLMRKAGIPFRLRC